MRAGALSAVEDAGEFGPTPGRGLPPGAHAAPRPLPAAPGRGRPSARRPGSDAWSRRAPVSASGVTAPTPVPLSSADAHEGADLTAAGATYPSVTYIQGDPVSK